MLLDGKVAVVTGAGRAIGRQIALCFAAEGAHVALLARSAGALEQVAASIREAGREALVVPTDLRDPGAIAEAADRTLRTFGRVDALVNNSGVGGPSAPLWEIQPEDWEETFRVNVTGTYLCCRAFLPAMIERGQGSVVMIGSVTGKRPLVDRTPYAASKMALVGLVRTLAHEVGPLGVRVNLISPGGVEGERLNWVLDRQAQAEGISREQARERFASASPLRQLVAADDIAHAAAFLASSRAASITGEDMNVNAGIAMY